MFIKRGSDEYKDLSKTSEKYAKLESELVLYSEFYNDFGGKFPFSIRWTRDFCPILRNKYKDNEIIMNYLKNFSLFNDCTVDDIFNFENINKFSVNKISEDISTKLKSLHDSLDILSGTKESIYLKIFNENQKCNYIYFYPVQVLPFGFDVESRYAQYKVIFEAEIEHLAAAKPISNKNYLDIILRHNMRIINSKPVSVVPFLLETDEQLIIMKMITS